jgi:hypothetical protein
VHGCGDGAVSAGQLKDLVPGTRVVEQGSNDRSDIGADLTEGTVIAGSSTRLADFPSHQQARGQQSCQCVPG